MSMSAVMVKAIEKGLGVNSEEAAELAIKIIEGGAESGVAGLSYYWPSRFGCLDTEERDNAVRKEFNGRNLSAVCAKYDLSRSTVYKIVRKIDA